jgi:hypothetical protein
VTGLGEFLAIVYSGQFEKSSPNFWANFLNANIFSYILKNGLGHILGDFFTNSSGHPVSVGPCHRASVNIKMLLCRAKK